MYKTKTAANTDDMDNQSNFFPELQSYIASLLPEMDNIRPERKELLRGLARFVESKIGAGEPIQLTFICTHNSRRSHFGQIWAAVAAAWYGIADVHTFSGGTEATAFNPRAVAAVQQAGFRVENPGGDNPHYMVRFSEAGPALECFSKTFDDPHNPSRHFAAVMTCSDADENCPFIPGAAYRAPVTYEDPKEADGTPQEAARYAERCRQVATELLYVFSQMKTSKI
jgi:arsenate reductase (thioredoxin)